jgi:hypothetical protein
MHSPARFTRICAVAITSDGTMFALDRFAELVLVFAADGTSQLPFSIRDHQWPINQLEVFVGFFEAAQTLLLVDVSNFGESHLMAVNSGSRTVRWSTHLEKGGCWGIELLFTHSWHQCVVIINSYSHNNLSAYRASDGIMLFQAKHVSPFDVACDSDNSTVYVSSSENVSVFRWNGKALVFDRIVVTIRDGGYVRLAVVPSTRRHDTSYLVLGKRFTSILRVYALPECRLVQTHRLENIVISDLVADPSGTALAVCDFNVRSVHVLSWPLY